ncbi:hypothetical protein LG293_17685 (plasmid) [Citricoccus nitrophenolicus]
MTATPSENRNRQPKGVATGGQFATENKPEADTTLTSPAPTQGAERELHVSVTDRLTEPGHYTGKPLLMEVAPDEISFGDFSEPNWHNAATVDIAQHLAEDENLRDHLATAMTEQDGSLHEVGDELFDASTDDLAGEDYSDGYTCRLTSGEAQATLEWLDDNPAWTQDGITPHPTGGYVTVDRGRYGEAYLNRDGELHRTDGPAEDDTIEGRRFQKWRIHGTPIRPGGGPSTQQIHLATGKVLTEHWTDDQGRLHREDGPAYQESDGYQAWYRNGEQTHERPAVIGLKPGEAVTTDGTILSLRIQNEATQ